MPRCILYPMIGVIIPAAGKGVRFGSEQPKQYAMLCGIPVIAHTINSALDVPHVSAIVVAVDAEHEEQMHELIGRYINSPLVCVVIGGASRQDSVYAALKHNELDPTSIVLVHDAARPLASRELWDSVVDGASTHGACIPVAPVTDTLKKLNSDGFVAGTVDRSLYGRAQTPQGFSTRLLRRAFEHAYQQGSVGTDCSALVEALGEPVKVVDGDHQNIKITSKSDLYMAESLVQGRSSQGL